MGKKTCLPTKMCTYTDWTSWGTCSRSCGGGYKEKLLSCAQLAWVNRASALTASQERSRDIRVPAVTGDPLDACQLHDLVPRSLGKVVVFVQV